MVGAGVEARDDPERGAQRRQRRRRCVGSGHGAFAYRAVVIGRPVTDPDDGGFTLTETLGERLQAQGKSLVTIGSGTSGASLLLNPTAPDGTGVMINAGSEDGPRAFPADVGQEMQRRFGPPPANPGTSKVAYVIRALNDYVLTDLNPDVVLTWMTEPDGSQHQHGVGSPEATATICNDDRNIGLVLQQLKKLQIADRTNIMVVSDHGFSVTDYAVNVSQELVKAGLKQSATSTDVIVANTGSVALHVKDRDPARIEAISRFLLRRPDADTVLLELIGHANPEGGADIVVTFPWSAKPNAYGVPGSAATSAGGTAPTGARTGNASTHGSFSPYDVQNTFLGWGVDFKDGTVSQVPAGNIDVVPTRLALEGLTTRGTEGRILREGLNGGPAPTSVRSKTRSLTVSSKQDDYRGEQSELCCADRRTSGRGLSTRPGSGGRGKPRGAGRGTAVPVDDEYGGVVAHCPAIDIEDGAGEHLHRLAWVQVTERGEKLLDLGFGCVALEHAVGDQGEPVAGVELEALQRVGLVGCDSEDEPGVEGDLADLPVADEQRVHVAGVDQLQAAASQVDAPEQGRDELVGGGVRGDVRAGLPGLVDEPEAAPATVAQAADTEGGELSGMTAVPHGVGARQVERVAVDHVVEGVAAGLIGGYQPPGEGELRSLAGVGGRQEPALDLGFQGQNGAALPELVQVGEPAISDGHVGEGVAS